MGQNGREAYIRIYPSPALPRFASKIVGKVSLHAPQSVLDRGLKMGILTSEPVVPLQELYSTNEPLVRVDAGKVQVEIRRYLLDAGGYREMLGIFFIPSDNRPGFYKGELYGIAYAPGRFTPSHIGREESTKGTTREKEVLRSLIARGERSFPGLITALNEDGIAEEYISSIPRLHLAGALNVLGENLSEMSQSEREIISLLLVHRAVEQVKKFHAAGYVHTHPHGGNFHVTEDFRVTLLDFDSAQEISSEHTPESDIVYMQERIFSSYFVGFNTLKSAGLTEHSTPEDIEKKLLQLCREHNIDLTNHKTISALSSKFKGALVRAHYEQMLPMSPALREVERTPEDIIRIAEAIDQAIEQIPTILLDKPQGRILRRNR